jgi:hypothetical protein
MTAPLLTIVIAVKGAAENLGDIFGRLSCERHPLVQFCFACAGPPPAILPRSGNCETVEGPDRALVPELWRDGILRAKAERVALMTTQCVPDPDWIEALLRLDLVAYAGIGGAIDLGASCSGAQRAVYLLRFSAFTPQRGIGVVSDIAADNAVYRTSAILMHGDLLEKGFWEPSFHRRFAGQALKLQFDPSLLVTYCGREQPLPFMGLRFSHGREYGFSRANNAPLARRLAWVFASPLIAPLIFGRVIARAASRPRLRRTLPSALPWLMLFTVAWSIGEARGYIDALAPKGTKAARS